MLRTSFHVLAAAALIAAVAGSSIAAQSAPAPTPNAESALNYEFFKNRVQPVFTTKRAGHTRCVVCHTVNNARFHLVPMSPGATTWNEQQSRQNFQLIQRVAIPGSLDSPIVHHPLAEAAGGDAHHGGGQQFESQQDPNWQALRAWIMG